MIIGHRLRALRERKELTQGDMEKRTGLRRFYISRVENGHTIPSLETLEKFARALEVPLYLLFYQGEEPPPLHRSSKTRLPSEELWGTSGKNARLLSVLCRHLAAMEQNDRDLLFFVARRMAARKRAGTNVRQGRTVTVAFHDPGQPPVISHERPNT